MRPGVSMRRKLDEAIDDAVAADHGQEDIQDPVSQRLRKLGMCYLMCQMLLHVAHLTIQRQKWMRRQAAAYRTIFQ